ncbi:hypothetical protein [Amycolatopsis sp. NPDC059657]|uniref:hypothetical protein n=1 Tax=Amycolatopsis sp. NPDC059657 TaxID=3346899 RepID=UPI00366E013A
MMKKTLLAALALTAAGMTLGTAGPASAGTDNWGCPDGYSCYYKYDLGGRPQWNAPAPGCYSIGATGLGQIASISNRGGGPIRLTDNNGDYYLTVYPGRQEISLDARNIRSFCIR